MKRSRLTKRERAAERSRRPPVLTTEERERRQQQMDHEAKVLAAGFGLVRTRWVTQGELEQLYPKAGDDDDRTEP